jgi:hypothetical protein
VFPLHQLAALGRKPPPEDVTADRRWRERAASAIMEPLSEYPSQAALARLIGTDPSIAVGGPRRSGKTEAPGRVTLARCLLEDGYTVVIGSSTLAGPTINWLDRKGRPSAVGLLREHGFLPPRTSKNPWASPYCRVSHSMGAIKSISFSWGSEIRVIDVGQMHLLDKHRGQTCNTWWLDECQSIMPLPSVLKDLINPTVLDHGGTIVLTGTPGVEIDSMFGQISMGKMPEYNLVHLATWQNPRYGATFEARWAYVMAKIIAGKKAQYQLSDADVERFAAMSEAQVEAIRHGSEDAETTKWLATLLPSFLREIMGRWVGDYGSLVYHWVPEIYWIDHEPEIEDVVSLLPAVQGQWKAALGHDVGWSKGSHAWTVTVWADHHPTAYTVFSHTAKRMPEHEEFAFTERLIDRVQAAGIKVIGLVADMTGMMSATHASWDQTLRSRVNIPVLLPQKHNLLQRVKACNLDLARGHLKIAGGGDLDIEGRHLRWHPEKAGVIDVGREVTIGNKPSIPGDHCLASLRYSLGLLNAHWQRPKHPVTIDPVSAHLERVFGHDDIKLS